MLVANLSSQGVTNYTFYAKAPYTIRIKSPHVLSLIEQGQLTLSSPLNCALEFQTCTAPIVQAQKVVNGQPVQYHTCLASYQNVFMVQATYYPQGLTSWVIYLQDYYILNETTVPAPTGTPWIGIPFTTYDLKSHTIVAQFDANGNISFSLDGTQIFFTNMGIPPADLINLGVAAAMFGSGAVTNMMLTWEVDASGSVDFSQILNYMIYAAIAVGIASLVFYLFRTGKLQAAARAVGRGIESLAQKVKEELREIANRIKRVEEEVG